MIMSALEPLSMSGCEVEANLPICHEHVDCLLIRQLLNEDHQTIAPRVQQIAQILQERLYVVDRFLKISMTISSCHGEVTKPN